MRATLRPAALALALSGVLGLAQTGGVFDVADETFYDWLVLRLPPPAPAGDAIVVAIDDPSFADLGLVWPWPRTLHADLIATLRREGARRIGYDVVFADPAAPDADLALAAALGPDVVLAGYAEAAETAQGQLSMAIGPHTGLLAGGAGVGSVDLPLDPDGAIRQLNTGPDSFAALMLASPARPPEGARIRFSTARTPTVSFYQARDAGNLLPPGTFRDKAVFVGFMLRSDTSMAADNFRTPLTSAGQGFTSGVQVHAQAYRTLAAGAWITPAPAALAPLLAALFGFLTLVWTARGPGWRAGAVILFMASVAIGLSAAALSAGLWLAPAVPVLAAVISGAGRVLADYVGALRARQRITRIFGHYLAPELVRRLIDDPDAVKLGGERRTITVLFCDLRGFTSLSERMNDDPETLTRLVNEALGALAEAVVANGGMVDKFIGDCVMAIWNAPADDPDHADHAIAAGRDMIAAIDALSTRLQATGPAVRLACGVGINSGTCTVGNMGSERRFDYTAIGDPVNLASRLETMTKALGVPLLAGEATAGLVRHTELMRVDTIRVSGREKPETVFTIPALFPPAG